MPTMEMHKEYPPPRVVVTLPDGSVDRLSPGEAMEKADTLEEAFREEGQWFGEQVAFVSDMRQYAEELMEMEDE